MKKEPCFLLRALAFLVQMTWGLPQNLLGALLWLRWARQPHFRWRGAFVTVWPGATSMSLGLFLFLAPTRTALGSADGKGHDGVGRANHRVLVHEYGHTVQSLLLGPLYLPVIGLPSILWCRLPALRRYRQKKQLSYYRLYTEHWASVWGEKVTGEESAK